jgi:hypothetical protein
MALMTCPDCEGKVSSTALACPHCGWIDAPAPKQFSVRGVRALMVCLACPIVIVAMMYAFPRYALLIGIAGLVGAIVAVKRGIIRP